MTEPSPATAVSIRGALRGAGARLEAAGCDAPRLDSELLLGAVLGVDRARLRMDADAELDPETLSRFEALVNRRAEREPLAYILGRRWFRRIALEVDPRVLIPRPETELLVEVGLGLEPGARLVDVGTGSGAVALALKDERPDLRVVGADANAEALAVARANAARLGLEVEFAQTDLLAGLAGPWDAVLANLPYVALGAPLPLEITRHEPSAAVFAGPDGLDAIRRLIPQLGDVPLVALEVGHDQAAAASSLLRAGGFTSLERRVDLAGHERVLVARR